MRRRGVNYDDVYDEIYSAVHEVEKRAKKVNELLTIFGEYEAAALKLGTALVKNELKSDAGATFFAKRLEFMKLLAGE